MILYMSTEIITCLVMEVNDRWIILGVIIWIPSGTVVFIKRIANDRKSQEYERVLWGD